MLLGLWAMATNRAAALRQRALVERGSVATEYGLLLMLIALVIVAAALAYGLALSGVFDRGTDAFPTS
jgi:Flp pilus assembly pilin Flp